MRRRKARRMMIRKVREAVDTILGCAAFTTFILTLGAENTETFFPYMLCFASLGVLMFLAMKDGKLKER